MFSLIKIQSSCTTTIFTIPLIKRFSNSNLFTTLHPPKIEDQTKKILKAPNTVDFNVNGACNLNCTWCWGPDHKAKEELSHQQWKDIAYKLKNLGTKNITFTGGEPLMKEGLEDILKYIKDLGIRTTLSTNGLLLRKKGEFVLPYVDDIGLPLDGHIREVNNMMREGTPKHFDRVLEAMKTIQDKFPKIELTVRTVLSAKNRDSVPLIGQTLLDAGINPEKLRWKIYQITPIGMRKNAILNGDWLISSDYYEETLKKVRSLNPRFTTINSLTSDQHTGRYFHIYPDGKSHVFMTGRDGLPFAIPLGNIGKNFNNVIKNLNDYDLTNNTMR